MTYLADALRKVLGQPSKFQTELMEEDMERLRHVQEALQHGTNEAARHFDSADNPDFGNRLRDHACGFLAPLIFEMTIHWPSPLLRRSLELVDLPGIGILSNAYGRDHIDICDIMSGFGASARPSLAELAALSGIPAKIGGTDGSQVEPMVAAEAPIIHNGLLNLFKCALGVIFAAQWQRPLDQIA